MLPWLGLRQLLTGMSFQTEDINFRLSIRHSPNSSNNYDHFSTLSDIILHWVAFTGGIIEGRQISFAMVMFHIVGNKQLTFWNHAETWWRWRGSTCDLKNKLMTCAQNKQDKISSNLRLGEMFKVKQEMCKC